MNGRSNGDDPRFQGGEATLETQNGSPANGTGSDSDLENDTSAPFYDANGEVCVPVPSSPAPTSSLLSGRRLSSAIKGFAVMSPPSTYPSPMSPPRMFKTRPLTDGVSGRSGDGPPFARGSSLPGSTLLQHIDVKMYSYEDRLAMALRLFQGLPNHYVAFGNEYLNVLLSRDFLSELPFEIAVYILSFTNEDTIAKCSLVCKSWHKLCNDHLLWKKVPPPLFAL